MTAILSPTTIVNQIDLDDPWFFADSDDRVQLPGEKRASIDKNVVSRKQLRTIFMGIVAHGLGTLPEAEALDQFRAKANMSPRQHDIQLVDFSINGMRKVSSPEPITENQSQMIASNIAALQGTEPHMHDSVQVRINAMSQHRREQFTDLFMSVRTKGDLDNVMNMYKAFVGDPIAERAAVARAAADNLANLDISDEDSSEEPKPF